MIDFSQVTNITIRNQQVTKIENSLGNVLWSQNSEADEYFYIEDVSGTPNTLTIKKSASGAPSVTIYYSLNNKATWSSVSTSTTARTIVIPANGKVYLKATTNTLSSSSAYNSLTNNKICYVGGNIMSLLYGDNFKGQTSFPSGSTYNFYYIFYNNTNLVSATNLVLPATTLTESCYSYMFKGCTSLTTAPVLPATTLARQCYYGMFSGCTSLTTAPALPATTLAYGCCNYMFYNCTSLTSAPAILPATTLADYCYGYMFAGCTSLTTAPELPATALAGECYYFMFSNCVRLTVAPTLPATTMMSQCYRGMFYNCSGLTTAPELPATTLVYGCYYAMFSGCTSLNKVITYATNISATSCLLNWLSSVASTGDFYNLGGATYSSGTSGIPSGWTEHTSL